VKLERYASAQDAARAAAEAAQIIRRNEAQNVTERERHAHALAEVARLTSLEPVPTSETAKQLLDGLQTENDRVFAKWEQPPASEQVAAE